MYRKNKSLVYHCFEFNFTNVQFSHFHKTINSYSNSVTIQTHTEYSHASTLAMQDEFALFLNVADLDSWPGGGQGELVLEAFLISVFGAKQPLSSSGRTAGPVCRGSLELKALHYMRRFPNRLLSTGVWCLSACINCVSEFSININ